MLSPGASHSEVSSAGCKNIMSRSLPETAVREVLEGCSEPCFTVTESLQIQFCNAAWDRFALANNGAEAVRERVIARNLLDFIPSDLKTFYAALFGGARRTDEPVSHDYECSSNSVFRLYRMLIYPLERGFAVINSLRITHPHDRTPVEVNVPRYTNREGLIRMCANCRRTNRVNEPGAWDWVPDFVQYRRPNVTHGVCPPCLEYYYRLPMHKGQKVS